MVKEVKDSAKILKQAAAYIVKYRVHNTKWLSSWAVVLHPKNRGGEAVKSLRTKQIVGNIAQKGYDTIDASYRARVVEAEPVPAGQPTFFQQTFEDRVKADSDIAVAGDELFACCGSLSHSRLNCAKRNILAGKRGCMCDDSISRWRERGVIVMLRR